MEMQWQWETWKWVEEVSRWIPWNWSLCVTPPSYQVINSSAEEEPDDLPEWLWLFV